MGLTQKLGTIPLAIFTDASNNIGIGGSPSGSFKFEVTGTSNFTGALRTASTINMTGTNAQLLQTTANSVAGDNVMVLYNSNANSYGMYIGAGSGTNHALYITDSTRTANLFKVQGNGNVGIGTSSPDRLLQISNTSGQAVFSVIAATTDSADIFFGDTNNTAEAVIRFVNGTNSLNFLNGGSTRMTITNGGAVQLPKGQLEFTGTNGGVELGTTVGIIKYDNSNVAFYYGTGDLIFKVNSNQVGDIAFFKQDGTIRFAKYTSNGTLTTTSSNGTIAVSSDKNMKIDAGYVENGLDKVMSLKPRYFYWKDEEKFGNKKQLGFYAQEVNEVSEEASNTPEEGQGWGIYDRALIAILTKAVQELSAKVSALENKS
jgi:hypothetical protein